MIFRQCYFYFFFQTRGGGWVGFQKFGKFQTFFFLNPSLITFVFFSVLNSLAFSSGEFVVVGWVGMSVPTDYLVAPVLNWIGLGCDN